MVSLNLTKNMTLDLKKHDASLKVMCVALGWQTTMDLDTFAYLIDQDGRIRKCVSFMHMAEPGISLDGDDRVGGGSGDNETITVNFDELPNNITKIVFGANIYNARPKQTTTRGFFKKQVVELPGDNFGQVKNAFIRCYNAITNEELCRYSLTEDGDQYNAFQFATMEKINGDWQFHADGIGMNGSIKELETCIQY